MTANVSIDGGPTTFVLIPGAGATPRVYDATIAALRELGHDGLAPPLPLDAWPDVPTTVLAGRDDRLFPLDFQRRLARERLDLGEVAEIDGGHLPMPARPRELAERLVELTERLVELAQPGEFALSVAMRSLLRTHRIEAGFSFPA